MARYTNEPIRTTTRMNSWSFILPHEMIHPSNDSEDKVAYWNCKQGNAADKTAINAATHSNKTNENVVEHVVSLKRSGVPS